MIFYFIIFRKNATNSVPSSDPPRANFDTENEQASTLTKRTNDNEANSLTKQEQIRAKRREISRRWRERIKSDPEKYAIYKERERLRREKRRSEGNMKKESKQRQKITKTQEKVLLLKTN